MPEKRKTPELLFLLGDPFPPHRHEPSEGSDENTFAVAMQGRGEVAPEKNPSRAARNLFALYYYYAGLTAFLASDASAGEALEGSLREAIGLQVRGMLPHGATEGREQD